jgi:tetratricopeptide (TPR) repeat protein
LLGDDARARQFESGVADSEWGEVDTVRASRLDGASLDEELARLEGIVATGTLDRNRAVLATCTRLFDRFYADPGRRTRIEARVRAAWGKLPVMVRMEALQALAESALGHGDAGKALELTNDAQDMMESVTWLPENEIPARARLAVLRQRAGDRAGARRDVEDAVRVFDAQRHRIADIDRADALRAVAEAYHELGDEAMGLAFYRRAIDAGMENPNSRPRAEDLSATCVSLALCGVPLDAELLNRLHDLCGSLGDPW